MNKCRLLVSGFLADQQADRKGLNLLSISTQNTRSKWKVHPIPNQIGDLVQRAKPILRCQFLSTTAEVMALALQLMRQVNRRPTVCTMYFAIQRPMALLDLREWQHYLIAELMLLTWI